VLLEVASGIADHPELTSGFEHTTCATLFRIQHQHQVTSEQLGERCDLDRSHQSDFGEDSVKCASLQRIVQRNRDSMSRWSRMLKPDMAHHLPDYRVSDLLQRADQTVAGHAARSLHAAPRGINSSFT